MNEKRNDSQFSKEKKSYNSKTSDTNRTRSIFADLDNDDGPLSDMSIDYVSDYDDISDDETPTVVNAVDESDEEDDTTHTVDRNIQKNRTRKHILKDLEDTMDETNCDRLQLPEPKTFSWKAKDPRKNKDYKWETVFNVEVRTGRENVILNRPGPTVRARQAKSGMQKHVTDAMKEVLGGDFEPAPMQSLEVSQVDRSKCYVCMKEIAGTNEYKRKKNNLTKCKWSCIKCGKKLCKAHFFCVCESCK